MDGSKVRLGVRGKLLGLVLVLLVPLFLWQAAMIFRGFDRRVTDEMEESEVYAEAVAMAFTNFLESLWASELALGTSIVQKYGGGSVAEIEWLLNQQAVEHPSLFVLTWVNPDGTVVASTAADSVGTSLADRGYIRRIQAGEEKVVSDLLVGRLTGKVNIAVARAIYREEKLAGIVVTGIDPDRLIEVLPTPPGAKRRYGLVDRQGTVVYRTGNLPLAFEQRQLPARDPIRQSLAGDVVWLREYQSPIDGADLMGVSVPVPAIGWAYYSNIARAEVLGPARQELFQELVILLMALLTALGLARFLAGRFLRPILALQEAAVAISGGNLSARVGLPGDDELAATGIAFDTMAGRIQTADEEQKARVSAVALLSRQALEGSPVEALAAEAAAAVTASLGMPFAVVWEVLSDGWTLRVLGAAGWPADSVPSDLQSPAGLARRAVAAGGALSLEDVSAQDGTVLPETVAGLNCGLAVILPGQQRPLGVVCAYGEQRRSFARSDRHFLQAVANLLAAAAEQQHRAANEAFLAEASALLGSSLDHEATLFGVAKLAVAYMADICVIDVRNADGSLQRVAAAARDEHREHLAWEGAFHEHMNESRQDGVGQALRTGTSVMRENVSDALLEAVSANAEDLAMVRATGLTSAMYVPLLGRGQVLGVLRFHTAESGRRYTPADLIVAEELARRAALAMENAKLYRDGQAALQLRDWALSEATLERARLHGIFQQAPAHICILRGSQHVVSMANRLFLESVGNRPIVGIPMREGLPELEQQGFVDLLNQVYRTGLSHEGKEEPAWTRRTPGGPREERLFNFVCQPMRDAEGAVEGILVYAMDVTQEVMARRRTEALATRQAAVAGLGQRLMEDGLADLYEVAVSVAAETLGAPIGELVETISDEQLLVVRAARGVGTMGEVLLCAERARPGPAGFALQTRTPVVIEDLAADPRLLAPDTLLEAGAVSGLVVLIPGSQQPFGVLSVYDSHPRTFAEDDVHFMQSVAMVVSAALEYHRNQQRLATEHAVSVALAEATDLDEGVRRVMEALGEGMGWNLALFWMVDAETGVLRCRQVWQTPGLRAEGFVAYSHRWTPRCGEGLLGEAWASGEPQWVADLTQTHRFRRMALAPDSGIRAGFWIPLLLGREVYGMIECFRTEVWKPDSALLRSIASLGGQIGQFIKRQRSEEELRRLNAELEERVALRTEELAAANQELEAFAYSVSHDLRAPLRTIDGFGVALVEDFAPLLGDEGQDHIRRIRAAAQRMAALIEDLLRLSRVMRSEMHRHPVNLSRLARAAVAELRRHEPHRQVNVEIQEGLVAEGDERLLALAVENLLSNAWKFTSRTDAPRIVFGSYLRDGRSVYFVRDNGAGFDMRYSDKLFVPFHRLHTTREFEGTGIGLATVQRIIRRHGGQVWAEGEVGKGATFSFTL